jgi:flagellar export protein FliJ
MANYRNLAHIVGNQADRQLALWQKMMAQCDDAKHKLVQLRQYAERYRALMQKHLHDGIEATATMVFLRFVGQIESVIAKQEREVMRLEEQCRLQWQHLVEARREKRMYEILHDRAAAEKLAAALRRSENEIEELMGRIVKLL